LPLPERLDDQQHVWHGGTIHEPRRFDAPPYPARGRASTLARL
jgi:hypothetical protein